MKLTMNQQLRVDVIIKYLNGEIFLDDALSIIQLSERQFRRVLKSFRESGFESLIHGNSNKRPKNKLSDKVRNEVIRLYRYKYFDFNISHFREKLIDDYTFTREFKVPSYQTIRRILLSENLVTHKVQKKKKAFKPRKKYTKEGLMVQIDGSHHHWLLGHSPFCLTAAIDDATGKILGAKFTPTETTFAAMEVVRKIIEKKGCFQMLYSDKAGIYGGGKRVGYTNMDRAMTELGIIPIQASTPQAKGKIERLFKTLQDRLVSEMRARGISSMEEANIFLEQEYIEYHNSKFAFEVEQSSYRKVEELDLDEVFTMREQRVVTNGNIFSYESQRYVLECKFCLNKRPIELRFYPDGNMRGFIGGEEVQFNLMEQKNVA